VELILSKLGTLSGGSLLDPFNVVVDDGLVDGRFVVD
jgi:hypothetical protein